ncbi:hypothetical protein ECSTECEH250_1410 [Escherichia coli STEC_EH250]|nr:hypothetical protein ECSTECEH250_1410 [Escherichia coli STEC_EH250]
MHLQNEAINLFKVTEQQYAISSSKFLVCCNKKIECFLLAK